ncbi:MAG: DUF1737 domain-containing protein, partial [Helicobacteraceae bacterium]|nr:DUF1737 domain-containing protein [Helicobacteraceae bacterium]
GGVKKIIDYTLECRPTASGLATAVTKATCNGWQPYGNPFATNAEFCQAIVKYEEDKEQTK